MYEKGRTFTRKVVVGSLSEEYCLTNKVLPYNVYPKGSEKKLSVEKLALFYEFMAGSHIA